MIWFEANVIFFQDCILQENFEKTSKQNFFVYEMNFFQMFAENVMWIYGHIQCIQEICLISFTWNSKHVANIYRACLFPFGERQGKRGIFKM